jgi:hypothetical protein
MDDIESVFDAYSDETTLEVNKHGIFPVNTHDSNKKKIKNERAIGLLSTVLSEYEEMILVSRQTSEI